MPEQTVRSSGNESVQRRNSRYSFRLTFAQSLRAESFHNPKSAIRNHPHPHPTKNLAPWEKVWPLRKKRRFLKWTLGRFERNDSSRQVSLFLMQDWKPMPSLFASKFVAIHPAAAAAATAAACWINHSGLCPRTEAKAVGVPEPYPFMGLCQMILPVKGSRQ